MFRRMGQWLTVLTLVFATGGHWAFLQSIAWVRMTADFSRTDSWSVALKKTFDGRHPCNLCKAVTEGKRAEKREAALKVDIKLDFFLGAQGLALTPPTPADVNFPPPLRDARGGDAPPTPPPRIG